MGNLSFPFTETDTDNFFTLSWLSTTELRLEDREGCKEDAGTRVGNLKMGGLRRGFWVGVPKRVVAVPHAEDRRGGDGRRERARGAG